ncbi:MAG: glycoside hydrolase family 2 [Ignavibacteria bacterium]|jgi:exo-1,4-beta-D-glucosaminidase|nr:glycoside hydrolase family 2 [Ignavibacteria bacterium]
MNIRIQLLRDRLLVPLVLVGLLSAPLMAKKKDDNTIVLKKGWYIQSSEQVKASGDVISGANFTPAGWYPAQVPSTVMGSLVNDKVYNDVFVGKNLSQIPEDQFTKSWWYRTEFSVPAKKGWEFVKLAFDGINYRANVWLNGKLVAKSDTLEGSFRQFELNVTGIARPGGKNVLAVEVFPPVPGEPTMGFVDWNPKSPDRNMGLYREVKLRLSGDVSVNFPFVRSTVDLKTLKSAKLTVSAEVKNNTSKKVQGTLIGEIGTIRFTKSVTLEAGENKLVTFLPEEYKELNVKNPRIWWTNDLGTPELYNLKLSFHTGSQVSDLSETRFGIREVSDYINENGHRGYKLNGRKILIRGGGWVDNLFLDNTYENYKTQVEYARHMNLNTIRLEGFWGNNEDLYSLCDENGILIMTGWSCQWEWPASLGKEVDEFGGIKSPEDIKLITKSWQDQIKWLRNHPSIFVWVYGSDKIPRPELEKNYQDVLKKDDPSRPFLASAKSWTSTVTGKTAVKMLGPYDYVPPQYWYVDKKFGGAYGFNTETGPGPQVPPLESMKKMFPQESQWPATKNDAWDFHCGGNAFNTVDRYNEILNNRMGTANNLEDYCTKAQFMNYEGMRAMFEAFASNKPNATGVIQWMYNSAWPKLWWQLYDYYLMPNGAFYGAKKACEPVHIQYNYGTNGVEVVNQTAKEIKNLTAEVRVFNSDLTEKFTKKLPVNLKADTTEKPVLIPEISGLSKAYFVDLRLMDAKGRVISTNFYTLSTQADDMDTAKTNWYVTPLKGYADYSSLSSLQNVQLNVKHRFGREAKGRFVTVELYNPSDKLAFQVDLNLLKGQGGESVLPVFWDDNYISLLPKERRIIKGYYEEKDLNGTKPVLTVGGWNVKNQSL